MKTRKRKSEETGQPTLFEEGTLATLPGAVESLSHAFRKLYYHLYTNSQVSRAERLVSDLSLLLLVKLTVEVNGGVQALSKFLAGKDNSTDALLPLLRGAYPGIVDAQDRFGMGDDALRESFRILESVRLSESPAHVLGDAFQALIGPRLRGDKGQFFTPRSLVRAMVDEVAPQPHESVLDPACGTSGFLAEVHVFQQAQAGEVRPTGRLVGVDKDQDLFRIASALLQVTCGKRAELYNLNSLDPRNTQLAEAFFDIVLTNPPFGAKIGVRDRDILRHYDLAYQWVRKSKDGIWQRTGILSSTQDPQILFLELCVNRLKPGGRLGIVLPEGLFGNKRTAFLWQWLRSKGKITSLIDCPRTTFQPGTDTKTNVLFFERAAGKDEERNGGAEYLRVAVPLHCGHDRRGRTHYQDGRPYPDDFAALSGRKMSNGTGWKRVRIKHPDYLVPRYYVERQVTREEKALVEGATVLSLGQLRDRKVFTVRKGNEVGSDAYGTGDVPFVRTSDVNNFEISVDPTKAVSEAIYEAYAPQQGLKPGDVLMVVDGRCRIGATALLTVSNYRCLVQSHFRILSIRDESVLDPYELLFALMLPSVKLRIRNLVFVQSTLGTLGNRLLELEIPLLHGKGPWSERVMSFRALLKTRDESLAQLRRMTGPECEL